METSKIATATAKNLFRDNLVTVFQMSFEVFPSARFKRAEITRK